MGHLDEILDEIIHDSNLICEGTKSGFQGDGSFVEITVEIKDFILLE